MLLNHFGYDVSRAEPAEADVCVVGSILELVGPNFGGTVIGAGFVADGAAMAMPRARVMAVRGPLSAARLGLSGVTFGDAGLLAPILLERTPVPQARVGIVPHFRDKGNSAICEIANRFSDVCLIDVQDDPLRVINAIAECELVLSSSLHGLIVAEAFGRPTGWLVLSDAVIGSGYKFRDHYAAFGLEAVPITLSGGESLNELEALATVKPINVPQVQLAISDCFRRL